MDETTKLIVLEALKRKLIDEVLESQEGYVERSKKILAKIEREENYFKQNE